MRKNNIQNHTKKAIFIAIALGMSFNSFAQSKQPQSNSTHLPGDEAYWSGSNVAPMELSKNQVLSSGVSEWSDVDIEDESRRQLLKIAATSLGTQAGMAARNREIHAALLNRAHEYDRAFDFSRVLLEPGFLPPVITEGRDAYHQPNDREARASDRIFKIEFPARIVSATPTWRTYLLSTVTPPVRPDTSVLPRGRTESKLWDEWVQMGWSEGEKLANEAFEADLARLTRDFQGMLRFKMLYEQGLVSKPILSRSSLGVTGGGDEMAINDRIIRITHDASLDANEKNWSTNQPKTHEKD